MESGQWHNCRHLSLLECSMFCAECPLEVFSTQWPGWVPGTATVPGLFMSPSFKGFSSSCVFFFSFSFGRGVLTNLECGNTVSIAVTQSQKYGHLVTQKSQKGKNKKSELHPKSQLARPKLFYVQELWLTLLIYRNVLLTYVCVLFFYLFACLFFFFPLVLSGT